MAKNEKAPAFAKATAGKQPTTNNLQLTTRLTWLPNKTFELEFEIPWEQVKQAFDKALNQFAQQTTIRGFRKGKAPLELIKQQVDKKKLYQEALYKLLPQTYLSSITKHNLRPICDPKIIPLKTEEDKDWSFKAVACEAPQVLLGDCEAKIKHFHAQDKIWVPGKDTKINPKKDQKDKETGVKEVLEILLKECRVDLPQILVDEETKRMLARLLEEIKRLGLTLEEYLQANRKTDQQLREGYTQAAQETLKLEFILNQIAAEKKMVVEDKEIDDLIKAVPDPKTRENLQTPEQKTYISAVLRKRKVIDFLANL